MRVSGWSDLGAELDRWRDAGRTATWWWRDDDATRPTPALDRLLALRGALGVPLAIAVIPARATAGLAERLRGESGAAVLQHGWAHDNHAPVGAPKAELGPERSVPFMLGELARGWLALEALFDAGTLRRALVPPHNRIAPALAEALPDAGYVGLSTYGARKRRIPGLVQVNAHADIMDWTARAFAGAEAALALVCAHLHARRTGQADPAEPTGLLTHHLAHDEAAWAFTEKLLARFKAHPAAAFVHPRDLFADEHACTDIQAAS